MGDRTLIVSDIDGTIANRGKISPRTWAAIQAVQEAGFLFVVATGRTAGLLNPVDEYGYDGIAICDNGALTYDVGRHYVLACEMIEAPLVHQIVTDINAEQPDLFLGISRIHPDPRSMFSEQRQIDEFDFGQGALEIGEFGALPAPKIWAINRSRGSSEIASSIEPIVGGRLEVAWSSESSGLVEMTARGVTKASAVAALATRWGVPQRDVIAMGDMANDLEMLSWAGTAIVPENGIPEAKAVATQVIGDIADDGTAAYLESLIS